MASPSVAKIADAMLAHSAPKYSFSFTPFLQQTYQHSLPSDRPICKVYASGGNCPNGTRCLERHVADPSQLSNAQSGYGSGKRDGPAFNSLVCKHWLRGLCKKGDGCEFLHEYNLRRMPECNFYIRNGYCQNGEECLYLHIDPQSKLPPCPHYDQGFCPLGPRCSKKHVRRNLCPYYLCGFCPDGRLCKQGAHPGWNPKLDPPTVKVEKPAGEEDAMGFAARGGAYDDHEDGDRGGQQRGDRRGGYGQRDGKFGGGGGGGGGRGGWRGRGGGHRGRGRY
ncbi:RNA-binding component of cleavage and polyadenylation factor [Pyricularia oryzae]|uniref:mRNA 3'-end-processing protein n=1 Tax=Pyricularia grisea TaxID=148305 RepID=A0ABQ8N4J2_PYRGI|nr:RNA-binding component of cleavage and polyadenylation factor [Pyricularia oryzae]KAI6290805.1 RNA-binding component of cleavage and polyadenylation factor [Pyricularia grisea]KAI6260212.1 RNA-binding component of cleavage and polyadenylation factor [Pyricularia oryzae]KAI6278869.1 RNA-binding component of cleavage and polyadenylation factor [Pyricularia oryzae]KAI6279002.1 RNA-binding component of cleavage and polyadenylation factor [Pyricularia oryzae]